MVSSVEKKAVREKALLVLYTKAFPLAANYISRMGGSLEEAKDIFHDALVIYYEKRCTVISDITYSEKAYLLGITKNLWHHRFKEKRKNVAIDHLLEDVIRDFYTKDPTASRIGQLLERAGDKCMRLLSAFYYDQLSMEKIAKRFNFSNERSATVQKHKCLEKVKTVVKQKSLSYEDFLE